MDSETIAESGSASRYNTNVNLLFFLSINISL